MKFKRLALLAAVCATTLFGLAACGSKSSEQSGDKTTITFWAAPNPPQVKYWKKMATEFEKKNPKITVKVSQMKESPTSEATIQSAIASGTAPTMSENITRSFAAQLAKSKAIVPLNNDESTKNLMNDVVSGRNMTKTIKSWKFSDGNQFVVPLYSNPMLVGWRLDTLKKIGIDSVPKTYSDVQKVADALKAKDPSKVVYANPTVVDPTAYQRWFDFFPFYDAASNGASFINGTKFVGDKDAGVTVFKFMQDLYQDKELITKKTTDPFESGLSVMNIIGPWTFPNWAEKYPNLKFDDTYTITSVPVPDEMADADNVKTYADAKGVVLYAKATNAQKKAAMKFLKFVMSDVNNDVSLLKLTSLLPARDDASTNSAFKNYFESNPEMKVYAANVPNAIPAMDNADYNTLQEKLGNDGWIPAVTGKKTPEKAWADMVKAIKGAL
ncbi:ABC transporter substrate-binding protein [Lapidilactobacillus achengensis]|uniref:ABC transporter substrate-binding protein n=1 Tax=Lapidilactobacillus achengensis TaxID=2486000 RepID=A0ABW1URC7_9LACO|nr:extracellular solute-binding protein [Lapidilactobacillus achengensis]